MVGWRRGLVALVVLLLAVSGPREVVAQAPASEPRYVAETGQWLAHGFRAYWEERGGLAVFGYPLTGELTEDGVTVQYFERARFEWRPGMGAPHDVQLGLVGAEVVVAYRLLDTAAGDAFRPAAPHPDCDFYPATGHNVCAGLRAAWEAVGGLPVAGYPLSEAYADPVSGVTVQYFERQRLEWRPGAWPEHGDVFLGRVGALALAARTLALPDAYQPAAGICATAAGGVATITVREDTPEPSCSIVNSDQGLAVVNATSSALRVTIGQRALELAPGTLQTIGGSAGSYLAPGVHRLQAVALPCSGPACDGMAAEVWLQDDLIP